MNLLIIGLGNIGQRHLESAVKFDSIKKIFIYDLDLSKLNQIAIMNSDFILLDSLENLPLHLDFCIVSTSSLNREEIIVKLLNSSKIKYLILEKVLFQKYDSYDLIEEMINKTTTKTYINCPRRLMKSYKNLKSKLSTNIINKITVTGGNWSMASNAIHFLDLIAYFSGSEHITNYNLTANLDDLITPSKREGYIEIFGRLIGNINEIYFDIYCSKEQNDLVIEIEFESQKIAINESAQTILYSSKEEFQDFKIEYVSQLTHKALESLEVKDTCDLIDYNNSSILHKPLILEILKHQNKFIESSDSRCLIT